MDDKKYRFYDDEDYDDNSPSVNERIFLEIISQVPDGSYWYCGNYVEELETYNQLTELKKWEYPIDNNYGWYYKRFKLTKECKEYLLKNLHGNTIVYFCHYMVRNQDKIFLVVFDNSLFDVDSSIHISSKLIEMGREYDSALISFSDPVEIYN